MAEVQETERPEHGPSYFLGVTDAMDVLRSIDYPISARVDGLAEALAPHVNPRFTAPIDANESHQPTHNPQRRADMHIIQVHGVEITVEGSRAIYIGAEAMQAIREDAHHQVTEHLGEAGDLWTDLDVMDVEQIKELEFKLAQAQSAISVLRGLAPLPHDGEDA